jgi:hypothetical protein
MKRSLLITLFAITLTCVYGQNSIDALFEKYAGRDGFTTVTINGNLLQLAACLGADDDENPLPAKISEIRILSQEDKKLTVENFYDLVINDIDPGKYEEFMRVKDSDQDLRILVRSEGKRFKEFLMIAGGVDNTLIQIKGDITFEEAKKLSNDTMKNNGLTITAKHK